MIIAAALNTDGYKTQHHKMYSPHTELVYSTWTPRKSRMSDVNDVVFFGLQYFIKDYLIDKFNTTFFNKPKEEVLNEIKHVLSNYNGDNNISHWEALYDLGYLPIKICAIPEGTLTPIRVPMFTIENTKPEFYWLTNFIETILSTEIWKPMTSATIALQYRKILDKWANKTCDNNDHVDYQGHDFSMRGMASLDSACTSGGGHLLSFKGTDTIPAILWLEQYYNAKNVNGSIGCSIPATEHSVAETNIIEIQDLLDKGEHITKIMGHLPSPEIIDLWENPETDKRMLAEIVYFDRLLNVYPSGFFSYVADTYNLWEVCSNILPVLKDKILSRDGRVVIRPDSGDPCDIICGYSTKKYFDDYRDVFKYCKLADGDYSDQINKGVIELLWDIFGGTINSKGYKVLDPHIGCIYGDAITLERADEICMRLESKGFASSNIVFGIGSYTYNMNTRDTFGFALKTTYGVVNGKELLLYKDPITDDGTKKSQKGMVSVFRDELYNELMYTDKLDRNGKQSQLKLREMFPEDEHYEMLQPVFENGNLLIDWTLDQIRERIKTETQSPKAMEGAC